MEIIIVLIIMAIASVMMFMQLKGTKPEVVPVMDLPRKKKSPKAAAAEKKVVESNWDEPEPKSASPSPDGKKKKGKRFDPVRAGQEMVQQKKAEESTLRERKPVVVTEADTKKEEKKARKQGFVTVEEKKVSVKRTAPVEPLAEDEPVNETVARLRAILSGSGSRPAFDGPREDRRPRKEVEPKQDGPMSHDAIAKRLREQEDEKKKKLSSRVSANMGGKVVGGSFTGAESKIAEGSSWANKLGAKETEAPAADEE